MRLADMENFLHFLEETDEKGRVLQLAFGAEAWNEDDHDDAHRNGDKHQRSEGVFFLELFESLEHGVCLKLLKSQSFTIRLATVFWRENIDIQRAEEEQQRKESNVSKHFRLVLFVQK